MSFCFVRNLLRAGARFMAGRRGNIGVLTAILIIPIVGALGLATEGASWFLMNRAAQVAADAAAIAAAVNGDSATYQSEGKAVASNYGFTSANATVTVSTVTKPSPCNTTSCVEVKVSTKLPLALTRFVGYSGDTTYGSGSEPAQSITATAVATLQTGPVFPCIYAYGTKGTVVTFNGTPNANLATCTLMANSDVACNGQNSGGGVSVVAAGTAKGCTNPETDAPVVKPDPYKAMFTTQESNLPGDPKCTSPPQEASGGISGLPAATNQLGKNITSSTVICGDVALTADISATGTLEIDNGVLDLNGHKLTGTDLTIVFSGPDASGNFNHYVTDSGNKYQLDIAAPANGTWPGVAMWQDPNIADGKGTNKEPNTCSGGGSALDTCIKGGSNPPTVNISGLVYLPNANVTIDGDIGAGSVNCFILVTNTFSLGGTGNLYSYPISQCKNLNLTPASVTGIVGAKLIF